MTNGELITLSSAIGAAVGAFFSLIGNITNNIFVIKKEREQRLHDQSVDEKKRSQDLLMTAFQNCAYSLDYVINLQLVHLGWLVNPSKMLENAEALQHCTEAQKWIAVLLYSLPSEEKKGPLYDDLLKSLSSFYTLEFSGQGLIGIRKTLFQFMLNTPNLELSYHDTEKAKAEKAAFNKSISKPQSNESVCAKAPEILYNDSTVETNDTSGTA